MYKIKLFYKEMDYKYKMFVYALFASCILILLDNTLSEQIIIFKGAIILTVFLYAFIQFTGAMRIGVFSKAMFSIAIAYAYFNPVDYLEILGHHYGERVVVHVYSYMIRNGYLFWNYLIISIPMLFLLVDKAIRKDVNGTAKFFFIWFLTLVVYTAAFIAFISSKRQIGAALVIFMLPGIIKSVHHLITKYFGMKLFKVQHRFIRKSGFSIEGFIGSTIVLVILLAAIELGASEWFILHDWNEYLLLDTAIVNEVTLSVMFILSLSLMILLAFPMAYLIRIWMNKMIYLEHSTSARKYPEIFVMTLTPMLIFAGIGMTTIFVALV